MSLRIASFLAWILGMLSLITSLAPLSQFGHLTLAARTAAVWLFLVGIALPVAAYGLPRRRPYAAKLAVVMCGLWVTVLVLSMGRALLRGRNWGATSWTIVITETIVCILIVAIVVKHRSAFVADAAEVSSSKTPAATLGR